MKPDQKIISYKAATPPSSGDYYTDGERIYRLIRPGGGDSWVASIFGRPDNQRFIVRPSRLQRTFSPYSIGTT